MHIPSGVRGEAEDNFRCPSSSQPWNPDPTQAVTTWALVMAGPPPDQVPSTWSGKGSSLAASFCSITNSCPGHYLGFSQATKTRIKTDASGHFQLHLFSSYFHRHIPEPGSEPRGGKSESAAEKSFGVLACFCLFVLHMSTIENIHDSHSRKNSSPSEGRRGCLFVPFSPTPQ